uniref:Alpha-1,3-mannosyl-glycoprotein 2-beta-N-acetylglucosaminyltransferase n=1 Tax=Caenorhabditis tropicalis TaxID=1561998 RepID=A0A1I7SY21_9PELO
MARIKKLTIASGKIEMFAFNLPGLPDNIRRSGRGTYWVGLAATRSATHPSTSVIITEDDLDIAPDLFSYFLNLRYLLEKDKTLWCVSAWNDNGKPGNIDRIANTKLYRSDFFPGLEWMMTRRTWQELEPKWPGGFWDDWMREPEQRKGRQCIRPEISRTGMTKDGRKGVSGGRFFRNHLSKMLYQLHIGNLFSVSSNTHILLS